MGLLERLPLALQEAGGGAGHAALALRVLLACAQSGPSAASSIARSPPAMALLRCLIAASEAGVDSGDDAVVAGEVGLAAGAGRRPPRQPRALAPAAVALATATAAWRLQDRAGVQGLALRVLRCVCQAGRHVAAEVCRSGVVNESKAVVMGGGADAGTGGGDPLPSLAGVDPFVEVGG
jgi:hypothetical protein